MGGTTPDESSKSCDDVIMIEKLFDWFYDSSLKANASKVFQCRVVGFHYLLG